VQQQNCCSLTETVPLKLSEFIGSFRRLLVSFTKEIEKLRLAQKERHQQRKADPHLGVI
jgi:hypothetical protein